MQPAVDNLLMTQTPITVVGEPPLTQTPDPTNDSERLVQSAETTILKAIHDLLDQSITTEGLSRKIHRAPKLSSSVVDIERHIDERLRALKHAMRALQVSISEVNREIVLLSGAERLMDSTAHLLRSTRTVFSHHDSDTLSRLLTITSSISDFASATVAWRIDLERLRDTVPTLASSVSSALTDSVSRLQLVYRHSDNIVHIGKGLRQSDGSQRYAALGEIPSESLVQIDNSMKELLGEISKLRPTINLLTSQVIPYLSDRRRNLKDKYLAISAICALFCTMPVDLLSFQISSATPFVSCLSFFATSCSAASFIISLLIVRFFDEACSLLPETKWGSPSRLILLSPLIFLLVGGLSFIIGLAAVVISIGGDRILVTVLIPFALAIVIITIASVTWYLSHFLKCVRKKKVSEYALH